MDEMSPQQRYLGNPLCIKKPSWHMYSFLVEKVASRLKGWKYQMLSHAGRVVLINSTIAALPTYFMSTMKLPNSILKRITDIMRNFWWGYNMDNRHLFLKAWKTFELPKHEGGLGIRNLKLMNQALIMKLTWQIQANPEKWWVKCLLNKYTYGSDFWNVNFKSYNSSLWGSILATRTTMLVGLRRCINNGASTLLYGHIWVPNMQHKLSPPSLDYSILFNMTVSPDQLTIADLYDFSTNNWRLDICTQLGLSDPIINFLLTMDLSSTHEPDCWKWDSDTASNYTVHSGYSLIQQQALYQQGIVAPHQHIWRVLWSQKEIPPKICIFNWRLISRCLPVRARLHRFVQQIPPVCSLCNSAEETTQHLFFHCPFAVQIWRQLGMYRQHCMQPLRDSLHIWFLCLQTYATEHYRKLFMIVLWSIWLARNAKVFQQKNPSVQSTIADSCALLHSYINPMDTHLLSGIDFIWQKPARDHLKLNVDAAFANNIAHIGCIVRNSSGMTLIVAGKAQSLDSPLNAELWAIAEGMQLITNFGLHNVVVESDCYNAVKMLNDDASSTPWRSLVLVRRCKRIMESSPTVTIQFCRRHANEAAHQIALHRRFHDGDFEECFSGSRFEDCVINVLNLEKDL